MRIQYNELNQVIGYGEIYGEMTVEVENLPQNPLDYDYIAGKLVRVRYSDFTTNFKIKMNSDRFVAMTSEVNAILPDLSNNVSFMGVTEIYLDVIDEELETLLKYFDGNLVIIERK